MGRKENKAQIARNPMAKHIRNRDIKNIIAMLVSQIGVQGICTTLISTYISYFYTNFMLVSAGLIGTMLAIGIIVDAVSDFAMGFVIERFESKWGHIKHWFLWSAIPIAVCTALLFYCDPSWSVPVKLVYFFIIYNLYTLAITTVRMPGYSAMSLCFTNNKARETASVAMGFGAQVGNTISSMVIVPAMTALGATLGSEMLGYRVTATIFSGIGGLLILVSFFFVTEVRGSKAARRNAAMYDDAIKVEEEPDVPMGPPGAPPRPAKKEKLSPKQMLYEVGLLFRNKYWVLTLVGGLFNGISLGFILGNIAYFCNDVLQNPMAMMGVFGVMSISMMLGLLLTAPMLAFLDAKWINIFGSLLCAVGLLIACVGVFKIGNLTLLYAGIAVRQFGSGMFCATETDLNARVVDYGEWKFGKRQDGLSFSGRSVISKLTSSLAAAIIGWTLTLTGYSGGLDVQPDGAIEAIKWMFLFIPMIFHVVTAVMFMFYGITNKKLTEIQAELVERHNKEDVGA